MTEVISAELDSLESFEVDTFTLRESCFEESIIPLREGDNNDNAISKGWKILEDAIPSHKKQQIEYISYLSGINKYRTKLWRNGSVLIPKMGFWIRYILLKNFSSFYRVIGLNFFLIFFFAIIYYWFPKENLVNAKSFLDYLYFSAVTYTTTGYGDITPGGWLKVIAIVEAFFGVVMVIFTGFVFQRWVTGQSIDIFNWKNKSSKKSKEKNVH